MARLAWNNVAAPDFTPAMNGINLAATLLARAGQSAQDTVTGLDQRLTTQQQEELARRMSAYQDPQSYAAALASGSVLDGLGRLKASDILAADARIGALNEREGQVARNDLAEAQVRSENWNQNRREGDYNAVQAAGPALQALRNAGGDPVKVASVYAQYGKELAALPYAQGREASQDVLNAGSVARQWRAADTANEQGVYTFDRQVSQDQANDAGLNLAARIGSLGGTAEDLYADPGFQAADAKTKAAALANIGTWNSASAPAGSTGGSGGGALPGGATNVLDVVNYEARGRGFGTVPQGIQTYGQLQDYGRKMVQGTGGRGSSATGPFQITYSTRDEFAPRALGPNWESRPRSMADEDKIAEAIFNASKGSAQTLMNRWASLDVGTANRIMRMPWSEARNYIMRGEVGNVPAATNQVRARAGVENGANPFAYLAQEAPRTLNDNTSLVGVAAGLIGENGPLKGVSQERAAGMITGIMNRHPGINAATAAAILQSPGVLQTQSWNNTWGQVGGHTARVGGNGPMKNMFIDYDAAANYANQFNVDRNTGRSAIGDMMTANETNANFQAQAVTYRTQIAALQNEIAGLEQRSRNAGTGNNPVLAERRARLNRLTDQYQTFLGSAGQQYR